MDMVGGGDRRSASGMRIVQCPRPKKETRRNFRVTKVAPGGFTRRRLAKGGGLGLSGRKQTRRAK